MSPRENGALLPESGMAQGHDGRAGGVMMSVAADHWLAQTYDELSRVQHCCATIRIAKALLRWEAVSGSRLMSRGLSIGGVLWWIMMVEALG